MVISFTSRSFTNTIKFMVIQLSHPQIILGMPWLQKWNPKINWRTSTIDFCSKDLSIVPNSQGVKRTLCECPPSNKSTDKQVDKLTISTKIAQAEKPKEATILKFCADFANVFLEKTYEQLPPHCPFDHTIDLKDMFVPKITKVYLLNPTEKDACKTFIKEHLKTGQIIPSKSPQATPFFFVPKKDRTLRPCQDYQYLNSHTIWNAYPLPLISKLIDDMKDSVYFTKFDLQWGYNNIQIKKSDQWKAAFITPFGLYEPMVIFFGFCNAPPTCYGFSFFSSFSLWTYYFSLHIWI